MADRNNRNPDFLQLAQNLILEGGEYTKAREAQVRSLMRLAEFATELNVGKSQRSKHIQYSDESERATWLDFLRTGHYQRRDMTSAGGGLGSTSGLVPLGFRNRVIESLKLTDQLLDPAVTTIIQTEKGSPYALPMDFDVNATSVIVNENAVGATTDPTMGMVALPQAPTHRTSVFVSIELLQDSAIPIDSFLATIFATRFARGFGKSLVNTLLAGSVATVVAGGATASGQQGPATNIGSDDLVRLMASLDGAYLQRSSWAMQPATYLSLMGLRGSTGNLVFEAETDAEGHAVLLTRPVRFCPSMPALGGGASIVLGDFSRLVVREAGGMTLQASAERRPETAQILYWSTWRLQGAVAVDPNLPAGFDKPFVTFSGALAAAAEGERSQPAKQQQPEGGHHHEAEKHHGHRTPR
jgi:HK97 family phage major capsid protein